MMKKEMLSSTRLAAMLLLVSFLWLLCGAPIAPTDWQEIPSHLLRVLRQTPMRMGIVLQHWFSPNVLTASASAETTRDVNLTIHLWDAEIEAVRHLSLEVYVQGVVAAEMPAGYHAEALKCQAVAARTRAVADCRELGGSGCKRHPSCDVCSDSTCCQGWLSQDKCKALWGASYDACMQRVKHAVHATAGQILTWEGLPIEVLYHACAGGQTEDVAAVFSASLPYLPSVTSPDETASATYDADAVYTHEEAAALLLTAFPESGVTAQGLPAQLKRLSSTASGRIDTMLVGVQTVSGKDFRRALSLRSTYITWDADDTTITFHTKGFGHGVGMSQTGAQSMAADGSKHRDILAHYYPGAVLSLLPSLHEDTSVWSN